jgi:hypothetical protein
LKCHICQGPRLVGAERADLYESRALLVYMLMRGSA